MESRNTLIEGHIDYAKKLARRFHRRRDFMGFEQEDFESAAFIGLCEAADRFDVERGQTFQAYSFSRITGSMYDLLRSSGEMSKSVYDSIVKVSDSSRVFKDQQAGIKGLADMLNADDGFAIALHYTPESQELQLSYRSESDPASMQEEADLRRKLGLLMTQLPEPERTILEQRYLEDRKFSEIAAMLGDMNKSKVCRLHQRGIAYLRAILVAENEAIWS